MYGVSDSSCMTKLLEALTKWASFWKKTMYKVANWRCMLCGGGSQRNSSLSDPVAVRVTFCGGSEKKTPNIINQERDKYTESMFLYLCSHCWTIQQDKHMCMVPDKDATQHTLYILLYHIHLGRFTVAFVSILKHT